MTAEIVVGVDGSPASDAALAWALDAARRREAALVVMHVYRPATPPNVPTFSHDLYRRIEAALHEETAALLADALARASGGDDVTVHKLVAAADNPASALVERSAHADLLVVGRRGRGGFLGLLAGSVSQQCASHAHCPVVVVPPSPG